MKRILFINGCIREKNSRTLKIANSYINSLRKKGDFELIERNLSQDKPSYLTAESFDDKTGEMYPINSEFASEFAGVDEVIFAAPFYEFLFPAIVCSYFEAISIVGITFKYSPQGSVGLCKAKSFTYIYTAGDLLSEDDKISERYLKRLSQLYGISNFSTILAQGLDIQTNNANEIVDKVCNKILNN